MKKKNISIIFRLIPLAARYRWQFIIALSALGVGSAVNLAFPQIIRKVLNESSSNVFREHAVLFGSTLIALFAIQALCFYIRIFFFGKIGIKVVTDIRQKLFKKILSQPVEYFDKNTPPELVSSLMNDTSLLQDAVSIKLSVLVRYTIQVIFGVGAMIWLSASLSSAVIGGLILLSGLSIILAKKLRRLSKQLQDSIATSSATASESIGGIKILRAFIRETFVVEKFTTDVLTTEMVGIQRSSVSAFFQSFVNFLMNACLVAVMMYGLYLTSINSLSVGDLTSFLLYGVIVAVSFAFAISSYAELASNLGGLERVFAILDINDSKANDISNKKSISGNCDFRFENVTFYYPSKPSVPVLNECSFSVPSHQSTALVGVSGSGKSTVLNLLLGFYQPTRGTIYAGLDKLAEIDPSHLRKSIGYVPQDSFMLDLSIREAITLGDPDIDDKKVMDVLEQISLRDFVLSLPEGLNTTVGTHGSQMSGGQKQRIAITRALVRKPKVLILDEVTASLDAENERQLIELLNSEPFSNTTQIWVSHRLSSIKNVDHIVVFSEGKVVQEGSYSALSSQPGLFQEFVKIQTMKG